MTQAVFRRADRRRGSDQHTATRMEAVPASGSKNQRLVLGVAAVGMVLVLLYVVSEPGVGVAIDGNVYEFNEARAREVEVQDYDPCVAAGVMAEEGDFFANRGRMLAEHVSLDKDSIVVVVGGEGDHFAAGINQLTEANVFVFEGLGVRTPEREEMFKSNPKVRVYPYYLGTSDTAIDVEVGADRVATTSVTKNLEDAVAAVGIHEVNLLHIDSSCHFDVLEAVLASAKVKVDVIQVAVYPELLTEPDRYCLIQERLAVGWRLDWRYPYVFEQWTRTHAPFDNPAADI